MQNLRQALENFEISKEPTKSDWKHFHNSTETQRYKLWFYHLKQGKKLKDWAWGWRLGWIRVCANSKKKYCRTILRRALFDKAMVVRAEAATLIGRVYEGTNNPRIVKLLKRAYKIKRNFRSGKPMFVTERILFALHRVGGASIAEEGLQLAKSHPKTHDYWTKVTQ